MIVSIITPSFNSSQYIVNTISSVISQTFTKWEMIIVDDNSTDNSREKIKEFLDIEPRIKAIFLNTNVGAAKARNIALQKARGRFIAFLDSDDIWSPKKLEIQINFMLSKDIAFSFTAYNLMNEKGIYLNKIIEVPISLNYHQYLRNTIIGCLTVIIDKNKTDYFEMPIIRSSHDMALWLLILKKGFVAYGLNEVLASYRLVPNSNTAKKWKAASDVWKVYRNIEKLPFLFSLYNFVNYAYNAIVKRI